MKNPGPVQVRQGWSPRPTGEGLSQWERMLVLQPPEGPGPHRPCVPPALRGPACPDSSCPRLLVHTREAETWVPAGRYPLLRILLFAFLPISLPGGFHGNFQGRVLEFSALGPGTLRGQGAARHPRGVAGLVEARLSRGKVWSPRALRRIYWVLFHPSNFPLRAPRLVEHGDYLGNENSCISTVRLFFPTLFKKVALGP